MSRRAPGQIRDAVVAALAARPGEASVSEIHSSVEDALGGSVARSSVRSYLGLNEGRLFERTGRGKYRLKR
jgi:hypothetical protein